jgi:hypothetical protein
VKKPDRQSERVGNRHSIDSLPSLAHRLSDDAVCAGPAIRDSVIIVCAV